MFRWKMKEKWVNLIEKEIQDNNNNNKTDNTPTQRGKKKSAEGNGEQRSENKIGQPMIHVQSEKTACTQCVHLFNSQMSV